MVTIMTEIPTGHPLNTSDNTSTNMLSNNIHNRDYLFVCSNQFVVVKAVKSNYN